MTLLIDSFKKSQTVQQGIKPLIVRYRLSLKSQRNKANGKEVIHFIHIGKTGGTAIKHALSKHVASDHRIIYLHNHEITIDLLPSRDICFFFMREPISRFISGFYSRKRQGLPRYHYPWNKYERRAFDLFETPESLASALSSKNPHLRKESKTAMKRIQHVRDTYESLSLTRETLQAKRENLFFVGFQETLNTDFEKLSSMLGISAKLPTDDKRAHKSTQKTQKELSDSAVENLTNWYQKAIETYNYCKSISF